MPSFPRRSPFANQLGGSYYAQLLAKASKMAEKPIAFHIGNTHLAPPAGSVDALRAYADQLDTCPYGSPYGLPQLREAVADRLLSDLDWASPEQIHITAGATHGLHCAVHGLMGPGDELLLLAPHWPLVRGMAITAGVRPIIAPFYGPLRDGGGRTVAEILEPYVSENTTALYLCSPNNPCGTVMTREELQQLADFARAHDLWVLSDEVYRPFPFGGREHVSISSLPGMPERSVVVVSFSKSHGLAGVRCAGLAAGQRAVEVIRKISSHSIYHAPQVAQWMSLAAIDDEPWMKRACSIYEEAGALASSLLEAPHRPAEGGGYLSLDIPERLEPTEFLNLALDKGVMLAPGHGFGLPRLARLCFIGVETAELTEGIRRLNPLLT